MAIKITDTNELFYPEVDYIWDDDHWLDIWAEWKIYRKELGIKNWKYVPTGEKRTLSEIEGFARGNVEEAIKLVKHAIAKGWKGIHLPDNWYKAGKNSTVRRFPREWDEQFASTLTAQDLMEYRRYLRDECNLKPVKNRLGKTIKWVPKNQTI